MIYEKEDLNILKHSDIKEVSTDIGSNIKLGALQKNEFSQLNIMTFSGEKLFLRTESGQAFIGTWNILKTIANRNN